VGPQAWNISLRVWKRLPGCLLGSWALIWLELEMTSCGVTVLLCFTWSLSFPTWDDVDGLACCPHCPTNYGWQARVQSPLTGDIPSHCTVWAGMTLDCHSRGGAKPPGWIIYLGVDRLGPWWIRSLMENPAFTGSNLSDVIVIMAIMHVLVHELLC
jgi:hypothetical protein